MGIPTEMLDQFGASSARREECVERLEQEAATGALMHNANVMEEDPNEFARIARNAQGLRLALDPPTEADSIQSGSLISSWTDIG